MSHHNKVNSNKGVTAMDRSRLAISSSKLYLVFYTLCFTMCVTYLFSIRLYHPLLLPTKFNSRQILLRNENLCSTTGGENVTVMYIYSNNDAFIKRDIIRKTFGNITFHHNYNLRIFFVLGRDHICTNGQTADHIYREFSRYKDLVVGDFWDSYRNLSLKGIIALDYIQKYCKNAQFVIKIDDDVIVNTIELLDTLHKNYSGAKYSILGHLMPNNQALYCASKAFNKWCILYNQFNRTYYPPYMFGGGFVLTGDLVEPMVNASYKVAPFPIDDVYITGLLLEQIKQTQMVNWERHITITTEVTLERLSDTRGDPLYFGHSLRPDQMYEWWKTLISRGQ